MLGVFTDLDPSTHIVGRGNDRDPVLRDVDAVLEALLRDVGKVLQDLWHSEVLNFTDRTSLTFLST